MYFIFRHMTVLVYGNRDKLGNFVSSLAAIMLGTWRWLEMVEPRGMLSAISLARNFYFQRGFVRFKKRTQERQVYTPDNEIN